MNFTVRLFLGILAIFLSFSACSKSTEPERDKTPPNIELLLAIHPVENGVCPTAASYYVSPRLSNDNTSNNSDLRVRWDFDSDGGWDTEFGELDSIFDYLPEPLLQHAWIVTCEMRDLVGNSSSKTDTLTLPTWMPTVPDIVAGDLSVITDSPFVSVDTLHVGERFSMYLWRRDWINESEASVNQMYYIDNQLIQESTGGTSYPHPNFCSGGGFVIYDGLQDLGPHELRIEASLNGTNVESNLDNNSASRVVYVVE